MQSKNKEELTSKGASEKMGDSFKSHDVSAQPTEATDNLEKTKTTSSLFQRSAMLK